MNPSTRLAVLQLFSVCFCHLRSLVIVILDHVVLLLLLVTVVGSPLCSYVGCCCAQCALLHICSCLSSSAKCLPSQLAWWDPLVIQEPLQGFLSCDRVLCHQQIWIFFKFAVICSRCGELTATAAVIWSRFGQLTATAAVISSRCGRLATTAAVIWLRCGQLTATAAVIYGHGVVSLLQLLQ